MTDSQIDQEFREAVVSLAADRRRYRKDDATDLFRPIMTEHSPAEFRAYIAAHYSLQRIDILEGNNEIAELHDNVLMKLDWRFLLGDCLLLWFKYDADWKEIVRFRAALTRPGSV